MSDRNPIRLVLAFLLLAAAPAAGRSELLPIRTYTAADGLPSYEVYAVEADSRGFVWLSMSDGLSRFDGYAFTTYTAADGLPIRNVADFIETREGEYYAATAGGLARFDPSGVRGTERPPFARVPLGDDPDRSAVAGVVEARDGALWCATDEGLFRVERDGVASRVDLGTDDRLFSVFQDRWGDVWTGAFGQVFRVRRGGDVEAYPMPASYFGAGVERIFEDADGRLWVCSRGGIAIASSHTADEPVAFDRLISAATYGWITDYLRASDGTEWVTTTTGLWRLAPGAGSPALERVPSIAGACGREVWGVAEDHDGNLWLATTCGALRVD
jgi:ligand-binding sensor domain-containing protein